MKSYNLGLGFSQGNIKILVKKVHFLKIFKKFHFLQVKKYILWSTLDVFTCLQKSMNFMSVMTCKFNVSVDLSHFLPYQFIIRNCHLHCTAWCFPVCSILLLLTFSNISVFPIFDLLNNVKPTHYPICIRHMMFSHHNV